mmetsp:Transcript_23845/g.21186  ORF Transcript_23845/g.21186 Transcript_23845/m.21186 type:complete len:82 (-) Transcript_23845:1077-1322(-)
MNKYLRQTFTHKRLSHSAMRLKKHKNKEPIKDLIFFPTQKRESRAPIKGMHTTTESYIKRKTIKKVRSKNLNKTDIFKKGK